MHLPWYCNTNRDHEHSTEWEAAACTEIYELWQEAMGFLLDSVRGDEVEAQINTALQEVADEWETEEDA